MVVEAVKNKLNVSRKYSSYDNNYILGKYTISTFYYKDSDKKQCEQM